MVQTDLVGKIEQLLMKRTQGIMQAVGGTVFPETNSASLSYIIPVVRVLLSLKQTQRSRNGERLEGRRGV